MGRETVIQTGIEMRRVEKRMQMEMAMETQ